MGIELSALARKAEEDARLTILQTLLMTADARLNEVMLRESLDDLGHRLPPDGLRAQLDWLADNGAVALEKAAQMWVAELTQTGLNHLERRRFLPGVRIPRLRL